MAGTTVQDLSEVEACFNKAAQETGLPASMERIKEMQGLPKRIVVQTLWTEFIGKNDPTLSKNVENTYKHFTSILEEHYRTHEVVPATGAMEAIQWLKYQNIKICLTTGFYRKVTNIILNRLGWDSGLDEHYRASSEEAFIDLSLTPDETGKGRPHPDMILKAMDILGIEDVKKVLKIGDTPSDLMAGYNAGVGFNMAVTNGTHSRTQLEPFPHDALLDSIEQLPAKLNELILQRS